MHAAKVKLSHNSFRPVISLWLSALFVFCGSLACFAQEKGADVLALRECWRYPTTELEASGAASDGNNLYIGERSGRISAIGAEDGKRVWTSDIGGQLVSNLVVRDHNLFLVTRAAEGFYDLRSLSVLSGINTQSTRLPAVGRSRIFASGHHVIIVSEAGDFLDIDPSLGKLIWARALGNVRVVVTGDNALVAGLNDGRIVFIGPTDGSITRTVLTKSEPSALLLSNGHIIVGDDRGNITSLDLAKDRSIWTFRSGGKISGIYTAGDSNVLITSFDNFTYLVERETGHVIWKRRQPSRVVDAAIVNSNYAAVTPFGEPSVFLLDSNNGKSVGQIVIPGSVEFVQPAQLVGDSVVTFTTEGLMSTGFFGCKRNEKAEANASALK